MAHAPEPAVRLRGPGARPRAGARASVGDPGDGDECRPRRVPLPGDARRGGPGPHPAHPPGPARRRGAGIDRGEVLVIVQGHHGYISPSWYSREERLVPTWNFTVAHMHGTPQILDEEENLEVLTRLVGHFEHRLDEPAYLDREKAIPIAKGTVGLRIPVDRFEMKRKLSQNKDEESRRSAIAALRAEGPYRHPALAEEMERELLPPSDPG